MSSSRSNVVSSFQNHPTSESLLPQPHIFTNSSTYQENESDVKVYKRRWYILALYCGITIVKSLIWNTWGPIQATARAVYGWEDYVIDLMAAWGDITFCLTIAPFAWLMDVKGLRITILLAAGMQFVGAALRCVPTDDTKILTILIHLGQIIAGLAGPVGMAVPALLSSTWFPPHQRTTATAICSMAGYFGNGVTFLIGPAFVDDIQSTSTPKIGDNYALNSTQEAKYQGQINTLLYLEAGLMLGLCLAVLFYYPARPPKPPSHSAATGRVDFKNGLKKLLKNSNFLLLTLIYGASTGFFGGWISMLDQNLSEFGLDVGQKFAGWLGFVTAMCGAFSGIVFSLFADHFSGHLKLFLIVFMALSFYSILLICYVFIKVIPFNEVAVFVMFGLSGFFLNGTIPFFFELGVEVTYPVAEGITVAFMTFSNNFLQSIFLVVPLGHFGSKWMIWATVSTCAASAILVLFVKEKYNRSAVDKRSSSVSCFTPHTINT